MSKAFDSVDHKLMISKLQDAGASSSCTEWFRSHLTVHVWPKKMLRRSYVLADVIIFVYEVPCIFWRYINVDEVSWVTLKKLSQSAIESTKCDSLVYYKVRWTIITNCDTVYYKRLRQVLQSAMIITNCHSTSTTTHNLVTFNIAKYHQITRKNAAYLQINTSGLFSYTRLIQVPGCTVTRSGDQHRPCFHTRNKWSLGLGESSPGILLTPD